jgi:N-acylneuraminate cytidylyltransferase
VECRGFDLIVVSTDGIEIAVEAKRHGAHVVMRPDAISQDHSRTIDAVGHVLQSLGIMTGTCVLLQPTSPLRSAGDIRSALEIWEHQQRGSVVAVSECEHHPYKMLISEGDTLLPVHAMSDLEAPRQSLPLAYRINGAIYINRVEDLIAFRTFLHPPLAIYNMPPERSLDIDGPLDLKIANILAGV